MSKKLVVVCGATGQQGGSVVRALLDHGGYAVRALTRDPASPSSRALAALGVEVVEAYPNDKGSLIRAFQGAYAVFGLTISHTADSETDMGRNMVDACKANNVSLFIWSSLPSARETSKGKHTEVRAFDEKAEVDKYIATSGQPSVIFSTGGFAENLPHQLKQDKSDPSKWHVLYPFAAPDVVLTCTITGKEMAETIQRGMKCGYDCVWSLTERTVTGKQTDYVATDTAFPPTIPLYKWQADGYYTYPGSIPPDILVKAGVQFHTFEDYVKDHVVALMNTA
ncbi:NADP-binding protein [Dacryopinax primogenitus]|uniref:NADP-binding protein n=1 Tax=Dacryopinax primogenitus (strain DJM 731) TaxID=1858805 RepID=M5FUF8_DACPD|nr:NADP-binding protein [Dacryopinax primogenitus]EJU01371.1 NADP-binding protein [Dacryopinax primogenitus]